MRYDTPINDATQSPRPGLAPNPDLRVMTPKALSVGVRPAWLRTHIAATLAGTSVVGTDPATWRTVLSTPARPVSAPAA